MIIDIYTHILPDRFFREMSRVSPKLENIGARLRGVKKLFDLDLRFAEMDEIGDYAQVISLPNPPLEEIAQGATAAQLARVANDAMAELCAQHPTRFPAFVAAVALDDVDAALAEAERAITTLGARGIQIFTNIAGHPLDEERFRPVFAAMAALRPADLAASGAHRRHAGLCGGSKIALRDVVVLRLALRDQRRDGAAGVFRRVRPPSGAEDRHASPRRRHDPVLRRAHRRRHGGARLAHLG